jgi:hypothetical protein
MRPDEEAPIITLASIPVSEDLHDFLIGQVPEVKEAWNRMGFAIISGRAHLPKAAARALQI